VEATSRPPFLYEMGPQAARNLLEDPQSGPVDMPSVDERWVAVEAEVAAINTRLGDLSAGFTPTRSRHLS
jgi:acetyl esterase